jgi:hypothetical protein
VTEVEFSGTSMTPIIRCPAALVCDSQRRPALGDIVLFQDDRCLLAHRLVGWRRGPEIHMLLRGDNRRYLDPPLPVHACLGVVVAVRRNGKRLNCTRLIVRGVFRTIAASARILALRCEPQQRLSGFAACRLKLHRLICYLAHTILLFTSWRDDAEEQ